MDSRSRRIQRRKLQKLPDSSAGEATALEVLPEPAKNIREWTWPVLTGLVAVLFLGLAVYLATHGTWEFFTSGVGFVRFYDFQGASLLEGHWDVPPEALAGEAFSHGGRLYGYFGFAPALPRMVLNYLFPSHFGQWSSISMILGIVFLILAFEPLAEIIRIPSSFKPFLLLVLLGGSTAMFVCSSYLVFHEAILWGASLAIWGYIWLARYLKRPKFRYLALAAVFGFGAFFSRVSSGAGVLGCAVLLAFCLLVGRGGKGRLGQAVDSLEFPRPQSPVLHAGFLLIYVIAVAAAFMSINNAKFGTYFDQIPVRYNAQFGAARTARIRGTLVHPELLVVNAANYLDPRHIRVENRFPFFHLTQQIEKSGLLLDLVEPYAAFPMAMPALFALSLVGAAGLFGATGQGNRRHLLILLPALMIGAGLFVFADISYRYEHDWYPFFFVGSFLGVNRIAQMTAGPGRIAAVTALLIAGLWSVLATIGFIGDLRHSPLFGW